MVPGDEVRRVLRAHGMPERLLPDEVRDAEFNEATGHFRVQLARPIDRDVEGIPVRYAHEITGVLQPDRIDALTGVRAKKLVWVTVGAIRAEADDLVFIVGPVHKRLPRRAFE